MDYKNLLQKVDHSFDTISNMKIAQGVWNLYGTRENYIAEKVVLATGSLAKSLNIHNFEITKEIHLAKALAPSKLKMSFAKVIMLQFWFVSLSNDNY